MNESPLLVHVWEVDPAEEAAAVGRLDELFAEVVTDPASCRHTFSRPPTDLARGDHAVRTPEDRRRLEQLPAVRDVLDHLHGTANLVVRLFHEVASYSA